ncbi:MAG: hypothetical protein RDU89_02085 [bacterium]|nr:hypothetical protein [bacterium]
MRTYLGSVIVESLADPTVLDGLTPLVERVVNMPTDPDATTWHIRWYRLSEAKLRRLLPALAQATLPHWYAHFWSGDDLCVVLAGKAFWVKIGDRTTWSEFISYGDSVGVDRKWTENVPTKLPEYVLAALGGECG